MNEHKRLTNLTASSHFNYIWLHFPNTNGLSQETRLHLCNSPGVPLLNPTSQPFICSAWVTNFLTSIGDILTSSNRSIPQQNKMVKPKVGSLRHHPKQKKSTLLPCFGYFMVSFLWSIRVKAIENCRRWATAEKTKRFRIENEILDRKHLEKTRRHFLIQTKFEMKAWKQQNIRKQRTMQMESSAFLVQIGK